MPSNIVRVNFKCWNCGETFPLSINTDQGLQYVKECLYCGSSCTVDLRLYKSSEVDNLKGDGKLEAEHAALNIPNEVPTTPPKKESSEQPAE